MSHELSGQSPEKQSIAARQPLVLPFGDTVRHIDHDQFLRYSTVALQLDRMLGHIANRRVRILEVGPNVLNMLPRFLDPDRIEVIRCDIMRPEDDGDDFVLIEKNKPLPFPDNAFDAVVSLEVLEHIPGPERGAFLSECLRVASQGMIITCPNGVPEVAECERVARDAYYERHDTSHPFLGEHVEFGLPRESEVREILRSLNHPHAVLDNAPLNTWMLMILLSENLVERGASLDMELRLRQKLLENASPPCSIPYRKIYISVKTTTAEAALSPVQPFHVSPSPKPASSPARGEVKEGASQTNESVAARHSQTVKVIETLRRVQQQFIHASQDLQQAALKSSAGNVLRDLQLSLVNAAETMRGVRLDLLSGRDTLESLFATRPSGFQASRLKELVYRVRYVWARRVAPKVQKLSRFFQSRTRRLDDLLPLQQLHAEAEPGHWKATDHQPQFVIPCELHAGAVRVRLHMRSEQPGRVHVALDRGRGFDEQSRVELARIHGQLDLERYLCLDSTVAAIRFDAIDQPGRLAIERFELEQPAEWLTLARALRAKFAAARQRGSLWSLFKRAAKVLLTGDITGLRQRWHKGLEQGKGINRDPAVTYQIWREQHRLTETERRKMQLEVSRFVNPPLLSVLLPVRAANPLHLRAAIASVLKQVYPHWELCIAASASVGFELHKLLGEIARNEPRIRVTYYDLLESDCAACNAALQSAHGSHVALLKADDELAEHSLFSVARVIAGEPTLDMLYSDEDRLDPERGHTDPFFKPDWSPEYLLACMYTQNLGVYRTALVRELGGFREEFANAHEYDLALRVGAQADASRIRHIADVLYHRRSAIAAAAEQFNDPRGCDAARRAIEAHLQARSQPAAVETGPTLGLHRVKFAIKGSPRVSIVIPTGCGMGKFGKQRTWFVHKCVESIRAKTSYSNYEIIVLDNDDMPAKLAEVLRPFNIRRVPYTQPFNLASKMNLGAEHATGEHLILLNDDIEVVSPDWIESLLEFSQQPEIGAVGARLLFPDGRLQHVGVTILAGNPGHPYYRFPREHQGYFMGNVVHRNYSAVTGACLMTPTKLFRELGGFDVNFPLNYNDVDYCLRVRAVGKRIVYTPYAELFHHESVTKSGTTIDELANFKRKWGAAISVDPYYNPNLSMSDSDYSIGLSYAA